MPRTLTTPADTHRLRADVAWQPVVTVRLWRNRYGASPASLTLYLSTVTRYLPVVGGGTREYLGLLIETGEIGDSLEALNPASAPSSVDLVMSNQMPIAAGSVAVDRFSDLLREGKNVSGYDKGGADVVVAWLPPGGSVGADPFQAPGDEVVLFSGFMDTVEPIREDTVTLRGTSREGSATIKIGPAAMSLEPIGGTWLEQHGLRWNDTQDNRPGHGPQVPLLPPITCASGAAQGDNYCDGPSFVNGDVTHNPDFNTVGYGLSLLIDYTRKNLAGDTNVYEQVYSGMYRSLVSLPGNTLRLTVDTVNSGIWENDTGDFVRVGEATIEVLELTPPGSLAELQALNHDTIADRVVRVIGSFTTDQPGPLSFNIDGVRFIGVRVAAGSFPTVPSVLAKHFTECEIGGLQVL